MKYFTLHVGSGFDRDGRYSILVLELVQIAL